MLLFRENSENKFAFFIRFECAWDNAIRPRGEFETAGDFPHVDKRGGTSYGSVIFEKSRVQWSW